MTNPANEPIAEVEDATEAAMIIRQLAEASSALLHAAYVHGQGGTRLHDDRRDEVLREGLALVKASAAIRKRWFGDV